jgi:hypothetical protein
LIIFGEWLIKGGGTVDTQDESVDKVEITVDKTPEELNRG